MLLPSRWIDELFSRLAVRYGRDWLSKWEGLDIAAVKADWAEELAGFHNQPDAIKYGLAHLPPDRPPTVAQFRDVCRRSPTPAVLAITDAPNLEVVTKEAAKLVSSAKLISGPVDKDWAKQLRDRMNSGFKPSQAGRDMVSDALGDAK